MAGSRARATRALSVYVGRLAAPACGAALLVAFAWAGLRSFGPDAENMGQVTAALRAAGKSAGLVAGALLMIQFAMSARLKLLDQAFGLDRLIRVHAGVGAMAGSLAVLHPFLLYATDLYQLGEPRWDLWPEFLGAVLLVTLGLIACTSLWRTFLSLSYEAWRTIHTLGFAVVVAASAHGLVRGSDLARRWPLFLWLAALTGYAALFAGVKIVKPFLLARRAFSVVSARRSNHNVHNIELKPLGGRALDYLPGQFAFLRLRREGSPGEEHPFTISSSPTRGDALSFTIKESGDFTSTIGRTAAGDTATIDGPYGRFSHLLLGAEDDLLMIAGGVGITPFMSMLRYIADSADGRSVTLVWGNRTEKDIFFREELTQIARKVGRLRVHHVLSQQEDWQGEKGRIDARLLRRLLTREEMGARVLLCGPPPMMRSVTAALRALGFPRRRIHAERFSL